MKPADLLRSLNEATAKKEFGYTDDIAVFDYLTGEERHITVAINDNNGEPLTLAPSRFRSIRAHSSESNGDAGLSRLQSDGSARVRDYTAEADAVENFIDLEKARITNRIEASKEFDRALQLEQEIKIYMNRRNVPDFKTLIAIYKREYPDYRRPDEWWLHEVYVHFQILTWLLNDRDGSSKSNQSTSKDTIDQPKLEHVQHALLLVYNGSPLTPDAPTRMANNYNAFNGPGITGALVRQCAGGTRRKLRKRLEDIEIIRPFIKSEKGRKMLAVDREAIEAEYEKDIKS